MAGEWKLYQTWKVPLLCALALGACAMVGAYWLRSQRARYVGLTLHQAYLADKENRPDDAARYAQQCLAVAPSNIRAYEILTRSLRTLGQADEADAAI